MEKTIYKLRAFTENINGGNPAGVVLNADSLTKNEMLVIAKKVGYSETAFIMNSKQADFKLRFFTPTAEVDLCGHATIAAFNLLRDLGIISTGEYLQETKAGILKIKVKAESVYMEQNKAEYFEVINKAEIKACFKSETENYLGEMPIQIVSTGLKDIIVFIKDLETLLNLEPRQKKIKKISEKYDVVGIHAFSLETINDFEAHARNFAPRYGIDEEAATGTSNCALACYLKKYSPNKFANNFTIEQGYSMESPSQIKVKLVTELEQLKAVYVGGKAVIISPEL